jgi:hypothetical protein
MDNQPQTSKPISDDQELAKVLAGVSQVTDNDLDFKETPAPAIIKNPSTPLPTPTSPMNPVVPANEKPIGYNPPISTPSMNNTDSLENIKKDALIELRPLVEKLNLTPDEKFDIYLLLLRSTDDTTLIAPAHIAAKNITDETRRAQALLDIIKEIDYLSNPPQTSF